MDWSPFIMRWGMILLILYPLTSFRFSTLKQDNLVLINDITPYLGLAGIFEFMKHTLFSVSHISPEGDLFADKYASAHLAFGMSLLLSDYRRFSSEQKASIIFTYSLFLLSIAFCHIYNASRFQKKHEYMPGVVNVILGAVLFYISFYSV